MVSAKTLVKLVVMKPIIHDREKGIYEIIWGKVTQLGKSGTPVPLAVIMAG